MSKGGRRNRVRGTKTRRVYRNGHWVNYDTGVVILAADLDMYVVCDDGGFVDGMEWGAYQD